MKLSSISVLLFIKKKKKEKINFVLAFRRYITIVLKLSSAFLETRSQEMTVVKYCWRPGCQGY